MNSNKNFRLKLMTSVVYKYEKLSDIMSEMYVYSAVT
jgi:hypothetical protein